MYKEIFSTPLWIKDIDPKKLDLVSHNFKPSWLSETPSSFGEENNKMTQEGMIYLKTQILQCLSDLKIKDCSVFQIWRNIYEDDFQERHMHVKSHFSFSIYEKLSRPQTIFYHPAHDMIYATQVEDYISPYLEPKVKQNQIVIFPSYVEHLVKRSHNSMTISGNIKAIKA
tara:strand:+ start:545 stop:1054 length:510 start_codon:yes stop_codon:yes gene_type:complete